MVVCQTLLNSPAEDVYRRDAAWMHFGRQLGGTMRRLLITTLLSLPFTATADGMSDDDLIGCIGCEASETVQAQHISDAQLALLKTGKIVREPIPGDPEAKRAYYLIELSPERVWAVLTDFERWPSFMPLIDETTVTRKDVGRWWVRQDYQVLWRDLQHTAIYDLDPDRGRLAWSLDREAHHDIHGSEGDWQLIPIEAGTGTLVTYTAKMDAGPSLPEFVKDMLENKALRDMLASLRTEVLRRNGQKPAWAINGSQPPGPRD